MRTGEKFWGLEAGVKGVEAGATGEERLVEVLVVYGHRLHECAAQVHRGLLKWNCDYNGRLQREEVPWYLSQVCQVFLRNYP